MSVLVTGMIFSRYPGGGGELLLALALGDHAHDDGTRVFPSVAALAAKTRQSERTVQYQLRKMELSGWLQLVREEQRGRPGFAGAHRRGREYRISPEWMRGEPLVPPSEAATVAQEKGANFAPFSGGESMEKGATAIAPFQDGKGCNPEQKRVQLTTEKGATAIAPEPSVNHQYSNHQEEARGRAPEPAPESTLTHGSRPPGDPTQQTLVEFPLDWTPDDRCLAALKARQKPMPARYVIDGFAAHWAGRLIEPRRIPNEFVKWVARQAGMNGGVVPVDPEGGAAVSPKLLAQEARKAWDEVCAANKAGRWPEAWSDPRIVLALNAIGGWSRIRDMLTRDVPFVGREFTAAFIVIPTAEKAA